MKGIPFYKEYVISTNCFILFFRKSSWLAKASFPGPEVDPVGRVWHLS